MKHPNYYVLDWKTPREPSDAWCPRSDDENFIWYCCVLADRAKITVPMEWTLDLGRKPVASPALMLPYYGGIDIKLMRDDLLDAIQCAGADNLQVFPAILRAEHDPNQVYTNYKGVNIIGGIRAMETPETKTVKLEDSNSLPKLLEGLYINTAAPDGVRIFRLSEARRAVIIHERVKREIEKRKIPYVWFRDQGEWFG